MSNIIHRSLLWMCVDAYKSFFGHKSVAPLRPTNEVAYGVATVSRIDKTTDLFCRISSLL